MAQELTQDLSFRIAYFHKSFVLYIDHLVYSIIWPEKLLKFVYLSFYSMEVLK